MIENKIRLLEASEIECRVGNIGKNGLSLLLYKDARVDQKILDECFSPCGWKQRHKPRCRFFVRLYRKHLKHVRPHGHGLFRQQPVEKYGQPI